MSNKNINYVWSARWIPFIMALALIFIGITSAIIYIWADKGIDSHYPYSGLHPSDPQVRQQLDTFGKIAWSLGTIMVISWILWLVAIWIKDGEDVFDDPNLD